ncbi:flagellar hook protein FlgE [Mangrovitalea sediminis]|uniref:flagellar hook protein FlgE n=1 Tax=Mangrovitalea sediminis TaxID=1982043 RepID=UPI000BE5ABF6|nr:flagellar hook protein FlgE [Mangrovitalea sediminis]
MAFNIALSGLKAASTDLEVTGNNISNASTVGFKQSRTEFGDIYSNGLLSLGSNNVGGGVNVQTVRQLFDQGNIASGSGLDMAINGDGFFVMNNNGEKLYSRDGEFGVDKNGYVVNSKGMRLQGYQADTNGNLSGLTGDIQVQTSDLAPQRTSNVTSMLNMDATASVLAQRGTTLTSDGSSIGTAVVGSTNGIPAEVWTINYPNGTSATVNTNAGDSAGAIASTLTQQDGITASATTTATIPASAFSPTTGDTLTINGVQFSLSSTGGEAQLANDINSSSLVGITAVFNSSGDMQLVSSQGSDLLFQYAGSGSLNVSGQNAGTITLDGNSANDSATNSDTATVSGTIKFTLDQGVSLSPASTNIVNNTVGTPFVHNAFNPSDQNTYNYATTTPIYDSLGNSHVMTQYFVKEPSTGPSPANLWTMYVQVDGKNVGDPNTALPPPQNTKATMASYNLVFNNDGSLNTNLSDKVLISNWTPLDANGNPNGADGPMNVVNGGVLPIPNPPTSSNFAIDMSGTTQYGSAFAKNNVKQDGYATGHLTGLDTSTDGTIFARYSNGQSKTLAQVSLAKFANNTGLAPVGGNNWAETFSSGNAIVGSPGTSSLGTITASSLEESNVDLSNQLVNLIVAQRNYQANAKTIQTDNAITQTIINLR